jgi:hypothetical protein
MEAFFFFVFTAIIATVLVGTLTLVGTIARNKGRNPGNWVVIAILITPMVALLVVWLMPPLGRPPA